jgi:peroxiredoxin Q/BCP
MRTRFRAAVGALLASAAIAPVAQAQGGYGPSVQLVEGPDEGRQAPDFSLPWATKDTIGTGADAYGLWRDRGKTVVLAFYPRDFTKSDSTLLSQFRDRYADLFPPDVVVLGVSVDPLETHRRFAAQLDLPFRLLSDPDQKVAAKYGSKDSAGINRRTVYVIGRDGRVVFRDLGFRVNDPKAYEQLRKGVRAARR